MNTEQILAYTSIHNITVTVKPLCKDNPEMRTSPLIRIPYMVPAREVYTKLPLKRGHLLYLKLSHECPE